MLCNRFGFTVQRDLQPTRARSNGEVTASDANRRHDNTEHRINAHQPSDLAQHGYSRTPLLRHYGGLWPVGTEPKKIYMKMPIMMMPRPVMRCTSSPAAVKPPSNHSIIQKPVTSSKPTLAQTQGKKRSNTPCPKA